MKMDALYNTVLPGFTDLTILIFIHDKLSGLTRGIDDERITIKSLNHNGVLCTEVISRQCIGLPLQPFISVRQVLVKHHTLLSKCTMAKYWL